MSNALFLCPKCTYLPRFLVFWITSIYLQLGGDTPIGLDAHFSLFALCRSGAL